MEEARPLPVTLDDFRVQCKNYALHLSYRLNGQSTRVPLRDLAEARIYVTHVLAERLGAYRQAEAFNAHAEAFYGAGICPLAWKPEAEEKQEDETN